MLGLATGVAWATVQPRENNIVDLVSQSELILRGTVTKLSDGIDERDEPCQLVLGEQIDLQIQIVTPLGYLFHAVLIDENECG